MFINVQKISLQFWVFPVCEICRVLKQSVELSSKLFFSNDHNWYLLNFKMNFINYLLFQNYWSQFQTIHFQNDEIMISGIQYKNIQKNHLINWDLILKFEIEWIVLHFFSVFNYFFDCINYKMQFIIVWNGNINDWY